MLFDYYSLQDCYDMMFVILKVLLSNYLSFGMKIILMNWCEFYIPVLRRHSEFPVPKKLHL